MPSHVAFRTTATLLMAFGVAMTTVAHSSADDLALDPSMPGPVQVVAAPSSDNADPAALAACSQFASVLDGSAGYYESFAESYEGSSYSDPAVASSNTVGRTALRESSALAMSAANTPDLRPEIAAPMRVWSLGAAKLRGLDDHGRRRGGPPYRLNLLDRPHRQEPRTLHAGSGRRDTERDGRDPRRR